MVVPQPQRLNSIQNALGSIIVRNCRHVYVCPSAPFRPTFRDDNLPIWVKNNFGDAIHLAQLVASTVRKYIRPS